MTKNRQQFLSSLCILLLCAVLPVSGETPSVHEVRPGDTLYGISRRYSIKLDELRRINDLDEDARIYPGQKLQLPGGFITYTVERGDTLFGLARGFNTTVSTIRQLNRLNESDVLRIGQQLRLPNPPGAASGEDTSPVNDTSDADEQSPGSPDDLQLDPSRIAGMQHRADDRAAGEFHWPHSGTRTAADGKFPGVYIDGNPGDPVVSVSSGRVIYSGPHAVFGHVIFVQSPQGFIYVYGGNDEPAVRVGQQVAPGIQIGTVGDGQLSRQNSVFFSIWKNNQFLEPEVSPRS